LKKLVKGLNKLFDGFVLSMDARLPLLGGLIFLFSALTSVVLVGLWLRWNFRSMAAIKARQKYDQSMMLILCYFVGIGLGILAMLFQKEEWDGAHFRSHSELVLCLTFAHYALMNVYYYRVWILYYKCKLQNEFEKVNRNTDTQNEATIPTNIATLGSGSNFKIETLYENEQKEPLVKLSKRETIRKSWAIRYRNTLGGSFLIRAFWLLLFICECFIIFWTYEPRRRNKNVRWFPRELPDEFFTIFGQLICLSVLFVFPSDDVFRIKVELRLIFLISTVGIVFYYTLLYRIGTPEAYLSLAICEFLIMVAITWSNWRAVQIKKWCFSSVSSFAHGRSFHKFGGNKGIELSMMDILECESLFWAFERHLKREFSLENLNFIVAVMQYRQFCEKHRYTSQDRESIHIYNKETNPKTKEISMQRLRVSICAMKGEAPNGSYVSILTTPPDIVQVNGLDFKSRTSPPNRKSPIFRKEIHRKMSNTAPHLTWVTSQIDVCAGEQKNALFIFDEYCDRGAPQEINISRRERNELVDFFSHSVLNPDELTTIFDHAFDSILDLLANDSLRRFRRHSSFFKLSSSLIPSTI